MKHEIKIMTATDLEEANKKAIKLNFNRTLNMEKFHESVRAYGFEPENVRYPVFPLILHEHAEGKYTEPHMRIEIIGPYNELGLVMKAVLDCPMDLYSQLSVYDYDTSQLHSIN
jgi:hypothetical protein